MKFLKAGALILSAAVSMAMLTGCSSLKGKWHCISFSKNGERYTDMRFKEDYGYGYSLYAGLDFSGDTGVLTLENGARSSSFEFKEENDKYEIDFNKGAPILEGREYTKSELSKSEDNVVLKLGNDKDSIVMFFEKGESEEEVDPNVVKRSSAFQKTSNTNAGIVFNIITQAVTDLAAENKIADISTKHVGPVAIKDLDETDALQKAVKSELKIKGITDGYVAWDINNTTLKPEYTQWADSTEDGIVGQYPNPETDAKNLHRIGSQY